MTDEAATDVRDLDDIAHLFRVTPEAVRKWVKHGLSVVVKGKRGRGSNKTQISLEAAVDWYFNENYERLELDRERTRQHREQANRLAYENAVRAGVLGDVTVVARWYAEHVARAVILLNALPDAIAQRVDPKAAPVVKAAAREYVQSAIAELRADSATDGTGRIGGVQGRPVSDREPVGGPVAKAIKRKQRRAGPVED